MSLAILFPGQGESVEPTIRDWYDRSESVHRLIDLTAATLGVAVHRLFERGCRALHRTEVLQPVSTALSLGVLEEVTRRGAKPDAVAGHSLGEVAAACAAGLMTPEQAVALAALRGRLMATESGSSRGGMVVVPTSKGDVLDRILAEAGGEGSLAVAAYNTPTQTALSGDPAALRRVSRVVPSTPVPVQGAWHSPAMAGAVEHFRLALESTVSGPFAIAMIFNRTGRVASGIAEVPRLLAEQLTHPVNWVGSMEELASRGATTVITPGPARVLRGLARECLGSGIEIRGIEVFEDLDPGWQPHPS